MSKIIYLTQEDKEILDKAQTLSNEEIGKILKGLDPNSPEDQFVSIILNIYYNCNLLQEYNSEPEQESSIDWINDTQKMSEMLNKVILMNQGIEAMKRL